MSAEFWGGVFCGAIAVYLIALLASGDTLSMAAKRGFTIWEDTLYVVRPATPTEANTLS